jgi:hypothetical protein
MSPQQVQHNLSLKTPCSLQPWAIQLIAFIHNKTQQNSKRINSTETKTLITNKQPHTHTRTQPKNTTHHTQKKGRTSHHHSNHIKPQSNKKHNATQNITTHHKTSRENTEPQNTCRDEQCKKHYT